MEADRDPFAEFRDGPVEVSTSYSAPEPTEAVTPRYPAEVTGKPQISAALPLLPLLPQQKTRGEIWRERATELMAAFGISQAWAEAVAALEQMPMPEVAKPDRWKQIVTDGVAFGTLQSIEAEATGWTVPDIFGFHDDVYPDEIGLVFDIRSGAVFVDHDGTISISHGSIADGRSTKVKRPKKGEKLPNIWEYYAELRKSKSS